MSNNYVGCEIRTFIELRLSGGGGGGTGCIYGATRFATQTIADFVPLPDWDLDSELDNTTRNTGTFSCCVCSEQYSEPSVDVLSNMFALAQV